jgi:hypothetical protein
MMKQCRSHRTHRTSSRRQRGIATILILLLMALAVTVTVLWIASSLRNTQARQLSAHATTAAQGAAWRGVEVVRTYLKQLPAETLKQWAPSKASDKPQALAADAPMTLFAKDGAKAGAEADATTTPPPAAPACRDYPAGLEIAGLDALGVSGHLTQVCAADAGGTYRITARLTGKAGSGTAATTSTVEVVYDVNPSKSSTGNPTDGTQARTPVPAASFTGTLNYDGSTLQLVNGATAQDIAVDGSINFNGAAEFSACSTRDINFTSNNYCGTYYRAKGAITGRGATFGKYGGSCPGGPSDGVTLHAGGQVDLSYSGSNSNGRFWQVHSASGDIRLLGTSEFLAPSVALWSGGAIGLGSAGNAAKPVSELLAATDLTLGAGNQLVTIDRATIGGSLYIDSWNNRIDGGTIGGDIVVRGGNRDLVSLAPGGSRPAAPPVPDCAVPPPSVDVPALRPTANLLLDFRDGERTRPVLILQNMTPASVNQTYDLTSPDPVVQTRVAALFGCNDGWCRSQAIPTYDAASSTWRLPAFGTIQPGVFWVNGSLDIRPNSNFTFFNSFLVTHDIRLSNNGFVIKAPNFAASDADVCKASANPVNLCGSDFKRLGVALGNMALVIGHDATLSGNTIFGNVVVGNTLTGTTGRIQINGRLVVGSTADSQINFSGGGFHMTVDSSGLTGGLTDIVTDGDPGTGTTPATAASSRVKWSRYL